MSFDSKKTILLEKKYLYVRASLGFQLEGTSTEIIPTNNGFYRFYVDNLSKALGNSYVNIIHDSNDLSFQSFCSDLYMDELMSSDSSAIEDVVLELQNNTKKIQEFEKGVSSGLEAIHGDNVALTAKIEGFESGVSSAMLSNHEDNVALSSQLDGSSLSLRSLLYSLKFPCFSSLIGAFFIPFTSDYINFIDTVKFNSEKQGVSVRAWDSCTFIVNALNFRSPFPEQSASTSFGISFKHKFPSSLTWSNLSYVGGSNDGDFILLNGDTFEKISFTVLRDTSSSSTFLKGQLKYSFFKDIRHLIFQFSFSKVTLQRIFSLCGYSFPSIEWNVRSVSNDMGNIFGRVKKYRSFIPVDLGFHQFSSSYKGWVSFSIEGCDSLDLDFIKKCDLYFTFTSGSVKSIHLYDCQPFLSDNTIFFTNYPSYQSDSSSDLLCGMNLVYTGVSSAR